MEPQQNSRLRLRTLISSSPRRVTLVVAPPGYGKSSLLADYAVDRAAVRIGLPPGSSFARFTGEIVQAVSPWAPGLLRTWAGAYERALQRPDPATALVTWLVRHLADVSCTIAIDDLQHAADPRVTRFVVQAIERSPASCPWILASETLEELPIASWLAHGVAELPLDAEILRLDADEARAIGERLAPGAEPAAIERLRRWSDGVVGDFVFLLRLPGERSWSEADRRDRFTPVVARAYESLEPAERDAVIGTALLPSLERDLVERVAGPAAPAVLDALREKAPELFEADGLHYQSRFRTFQHSLVSASVEGRAIAARTADALEMTGNAAEALRLLVSIEDERAILGVLERHGFAFLESEHAYVLHDAIDVLTPQSRAASPAIMALLGISAALGGRGDMSESYFQNALKVCETPNERTQVRTWYGYELLRRGRPDAIELLVPDQAFFQASAPLRVAAMSALAAAYATFGPAERAQTWIGRTLHALQRIDDELTSSRVYHQASFIAVQLGEFERAKDFATRSLAIAERLGAYEVAAGALSVLYNVAADGEENFRQAAEHLRHMAVCGSKYGSIEKQLYALVAAYEIEAERGDVGAIAEIERNLADFDVQYSEWLANENLLPAQMLQLGWRGEFLRAHRILSASADQQLDAERRALRWSEIAIYAAAAGTQSDAVAALGAARRTSKFAPRNGMTAWRTRLNCALAHVLLGHVRTGERMARAVAKELAPHSLRLRSLAAAVEALGRWRSGATDELELLGALDELRRRDFGGVARWLEMLPAERSEPLRSGAARPMEIA